MRRYRITYERKLIRKLTSVISILTLEDEEEMAKETTRRKKIKGEGDAKGGDEPLEEDKEKAIRDKARSVSVNKKINKGAWE